METTDFSDSKQKTGTNLSTSLTGMARRDFLRVAGFTSLAFIAPSQMIMAGPFTREDFEKFVPADKKLRPEWVKSLFERGTPEVLLGNELKYVGMPVGGIGAGQLYLGGDGRLLHWDIFNKHNPTGSAHYAEPFIPAAHLTQRFSLQIGAQVHPLDATGFSGVAFRGEYPIGTAEYHDPGVPVTVKLEAFSPFIPLETDDSSLPATILSYTLHNTSAALVEVTLLGEMENGVCRNNRGRNGVLSLQPIREPGLTSLFFSAAQSGLVATRPDVEFDKLPDFGTMALSLIGKEADMVSEMTTVPFTEKLTGKLGRKIKLAPNESIAVNFVLAWHFPNLSLEKPLEKAGRYYSTKFSTALEVTRYIGANFDRLAGQTRLWRETWYDSTLPYWFLDRTMLNTSILATSTCFRFADGRFYGWEGVGCCAGTCGHVYHYAHAAGRLFPQLEGDMRERVDFGLALQPDGAIHFRGEFNKIPAIDGQAGTILRALREHQMSANDDFLKRNWPKIKLATQWLISKDANNDGLIESNQHNTLDADWFGKVAWLSGLYLASLAGAAEMADKVGDAAFSSQCRAILAIGRKNLVEQLFDGEYFINMVDPAHLDAINSGTGCEIDQVFGQSWAFHVGLPRVLPQKETLTALKSLWRYNFSPDVGPYRAVFKPGRWYAMAGEAGLLMCTFPRSDWDYDNARGKGNEGFAGYFNECMNGFEYQVAGHMIWEGMVMEGLAITRAVHDRYHASRRNPWNEVECGDHYARSMASYGVYLAACGYVYNGPDHHIGFAPRLSPEKFRCAFTAAEGWGSYSQNIVNKEFKAEIIVRKGFLKVKTISLEGAEGKNVRVNTGTKSFPAKITREGIRILLTLENPAEIRAGEKLEVVIY